tara:strand:+ start:60 stop:527 length:468 start_codon:yes stop_codon:yes gene_type:complete
MKKFNRQRSFNIDWILVNELAIGRAPKYEQDILKMKDEGIVSVLSLCREDEAEFPTQMRDHFRCERFILPDHKSGRIPSIEELNQAINLLAELKKSGPIFVHCIAAMERSPLVCMAWLIKEHNLKPQQSLDYMMQIHPGTNPLAEQFELLHEIKN